MGDNQREQDGDDRAEGRPADATGATAPSAADPRADDDNDDDRVGDEGRGGHVLPDEVAFDEGESGARTALPPIVERWRKRSVTGAMMTGFALGLREVLETEQREPAIVLETSGVPPKDLAVEADLENLPPRQSVVKIRRWLLSAPPHEADPGAAPDGTDPTGGTGPEGGTDPTGDDTLAAPGRVTEIRSRESQRKRGRRASGRFFGGDRSEGRRS